MLISFTFRTLPMGIVYAIWSGIGMVMIVAIGWLGFGQRLDQPALIGVSLILAGVVMLNLFSGSVEHGITSHWGSFLANLEAEHLVDEASA